MARNEAETRYELIDPVLRAKGYRVPYIRLETPAPVEPMGPKGRRRKGPGKIDDLLCVEVPNGRKPLPIAILEAKKEDEDCLKGMQQAKGYANCERFEAKFVFSTNGHRYAKFNKFTLEQTGPFSFADFPSHQALTDCYHRGTGIKLDDTAALLLFEPDSPTYPESRYYQDAAIRAAFEKTIQSESRGEPARVLLALATGSGKTIIAANLLWRFGTAAKTRIIHLRPRRTPRAGLHKAEGCLRRQRPHRQDRARRKRGQERSYPHRHLPNTWSR